jgi:glycosyltransferase involved in cell wall biosynthesis
VSSERLPMSLVIPTRNRSVVLRRTLESIAAQSAQPAEIIVVDASDETDTQTSDSYVPLLPGNIVWLHASVAGAAGQRNQGISACRHSLIGFFDDDILLEPECISRMWKALQSDSQLGGVNAMIINQRYQPPGIASRWLFRTLNGRSEESYAGKLIGPAVNLLPEDRDDLPEVVAVDWLNTTCVLYRGEALPKPAFPSHFFGYSLMEDVALSSMVGRHWKLANARTARIVHDSQPGQDKQDIAVISRMELVNRHYVMTTVLQRRRLSDYAKLALWECFLLLTGAVQTRGGLSFWQLLKGKVFGIYDLMGGLKFQELRL